MAIEDLNFKVILQDDEFRTRVKEDVALAEQLNKQLSEIQKFRAKTVVSNASVKNAKELSDRIDNIYKKLSSMPKGGFMVGDADKLNATLTEINGKLDKFIGGTDNASGGLSKMNSQANKLNATMHQIAQLTGMAFGVMAIRRFVSSLIDMTGQFEVQKMALRTMLQDVEAADKIFQDLYEFSTRSTYRFSELAQHAKQLAGFGIDKSDLLETTKMLGDVASGLGISMDRLILAYGHVKSSGFLRGIQLRSFSQNGVPILEELSKILTEIEGKSVSLGDVFDRMTKRQISFEMVEQAFKNMTSEGGKFYKMQEVLADTIAGKINILKGKWENALGMAGMNSMNNEFKMVVDTLNGLLDNIKLLGLAFKEVVVFAGAFGAGLLLQGFATAAKSVKAFTVALFSGVDAAKKFGVTLQGALGWLAVVGTLIYSVGDNIIKVFSGHDTKEAVNEFTKSLEDMTKEIEDRNMSAIQSEINTLEQLKNTVEDTTVSIKNRKEALNILNDIVPDYLGQLDAEGNLLRSNNQAIADQIDLLKKQARAKSNQDILQELYNKDIELQEKIEEAKRRRDRAEERYEDQNMVAKMFDTAGYLLGTGGKDSQDLRDAQDELSDLIAQQAALYQKIGQYETLVINETVAIREAAKKLTENSEWRKAVDEVINNPKYGDILGKTKLKDTLSSSAWVDAVLEDMKSTTDDYAKEADKNTKKVLAHRIDFLRALMAATPEVDWAHLSSSGHYKPSSSNALNDEQRKTKEITEGRLAELKSFINEYRNLLKQGKTDEEIQSYMADVLFPRMKEEDKNKALSYYYDQVREILKTFDERTDIWSPKEGNTLAATISRWIAGDKETSEDNAKKLRDNLQKFKDEFNKWVEENATIEGTGLQYDVQKIIADYQKSISSIDEKSRRFADDYIEGLTISDEKRAKAHEILYNREMDDEQKLAALKALNIENLDEMQLRAIIRERDAAKASAKATAEDKLVSTAKTFMSEMNLSPSDLSKMSISALRDYRQELDKLVSSLDPASENFDETMAVIQAAADAAGLSVEALIEAIKKLAGEYAGKGKDQEMKKIAKLAKFAAKEIASLADSVVKLAEATGSESWKDIGSAIKDISNDVSAVAQGFATGGVWGAAIAGVTVLASHFLDAATRAAELEKKIQDARDEARMIAADWNLSRGVESFFGKNEIREIENALSVMQDMEKALNSDAIKQAEERLAFLRKQQEAAPQDGKGYWEKQIHDAEEYLNLVKEIGLGAMSIRTYDASWWDKLWGGKDKSKNLKSLVEGLKDEFGEAFNFFDENGIVNAEGLRAVLKMYGDEMTDEQKRILENAINNIDEYNKALDTVKQNLEDVLGDISGELADKFIDRWIEAKDVTIDYAETLSDVAKQFAKMSIKKLLFDSVFTEDRQKELLQFLQPGNIDFEGLTGAVAALMGEVEQAGPAVEAILKAYDPYFQSSESAGTVGQGIKGITEDTASLLASYVNAMRSDLSAVRMMQEKGWSNVAAIAESVSSPTLMEYLSECAAKAADIAESNNKILSAITSVIGAPSSSGDVVRVWVSV